MIKVEYNLCDKIRVTLELAGTQNLEFDKLTGTLKCQRQNT